MLTLERKGQLRQAGRKSGNAKYLNSMVTCTIDWQIVLRTGRALCDNRLRGCVCAAIRQRPEHKQALDF